MITIVVLSTFLAVVPVSKSLPLTDDNTKKLYNENPLQILEYDESKLPIPDYPYNNYIPPQAAILKNNQYGLQEMTEVEDPFIDINNPRMINQLSNPALINNEAQVFIQNTDKTGSDQNMANHPELPSHRKLLLNTNIAQEMFNNIKQLNISPTDKADIVGLLLNKVRNLLNNNPKGLIKDVLNRRSDKSDDNELVSVTFNLPPRAIPIRKFFDPKTVIGKAGDMFKGIFKRRNNANEDNMEASASIDEPEDNTPKRRFIITSMIMDKVVSKAGEIVGDVIKKQASSMFDGLLGRRSIGDDDETSTDNFEKIGELLSLLFDIKQKPVNLELVYDKANPESIKALILPEQPALNRRSADLSPLIKKVETSKEFMDAGLNLANKYYGEVKKNMTKWFANYNETVARITAKTINAMKTFYDKITKLLQAPISDEKENVKTLRRNAEVSEYNPFGGPQNISPGDMTKIPLSSLEQQGHPGNRRFLSKIMNGVKNILPFGKKNQSTEPVNRMQPSSREPYVNNQYQRLPAANGYLPEPTTTD